jgi:hypothetical protein
MAGEEIIGCILQQWRDYCKSRGKELRFLREPVQAWKSVAKQEKFLRECERKARKALRVQRQQHVLKCWVETLKQKKLADAARIAKCISNAEARVPYSERVDKLLAEYERKDEEAGASDGPTQDAKGDSSTELEPLETLHSLINQDRTKDQTTPLLDMIVLAGFVQHTLNDLTNTDVGERLTEKHYILTGIDEDPLFSSIYSPTSEHKRDGAAPVDTDFLEMLDDSMFMFDADNDNLSQHHIDELIAIEKNTFPLTNGANTISLLDSIAFTAKSNLHKMKHEVHKSLMDVRGSHIHLTNYTEFIEKKKKQQIQCQRDLKEHCCTCRGPHIAKPPFSHGKDYRREPTHEHCQNDKCSFIKKKRMELQWLDETIGKYDSNQERFERNIALCEDETERRKNSLKDALANSLRLMEMTT